MNSLFCIHAPGTGVLVPETVLLQLCGRLIHGSDTRIDKQLVAGKSADRRLAAGGGCRRLAALVERVGRCGAGAHDCRQLRSDLGAAGSHLAQSGRTASALGGALHTGRAWLNDRTARAGRPAGRRDLAVCAGPCTRHRGHLPLGVAGAQGLGAVGPFHPNVVRATPLCAHAWMCRRHGPIARLQSPAIARVVGVPPFVRDTLLQRSCRRRHLPAVRAGFRLPCWGTDHEQ